MGTATARVTLGHKVDKSHQHAQPEPECNNVFIIAWWQKYLDIVASAKYPWTNFPRSSTARSSSSFIATTSSSLVLRSYIYKKQIEEVKWRQ